MSSFKIHYELAYDKSIYAHSIIQCEDDWDGESLRDAILAKHHRENTDEPSLWVFHPPRDFRFRGPIEDNDEEIDLIEQLSTVIEGERKGKMYVAIDLPPMFEIDVATLDSDVLNFTATILISSENTVATLRNRILEDSKKKRISHLRSHTFTLSLPGEVTVLERSKKLIDVWRDLSPKGLKQSKFIQIRFLPPSFTHPSNEEQVLKRPLDAKISVVPPSKRTKLYGEQALFVENLTKSSSASQLAYHTKFRKFQENDNKYLHFGYPFERSGPPVGLYDPIFDAFKEGLKSNDEIPLKMKEYVFEYTLKSSSFFRAEDSHQEDMKNLLRWLFGDIPLSVKYKKAVSDGTIITPSPNNDSSIPILICEMKNEIRTGKSDSSVQAAVNYTHTIANGFYEQFLEKTWCPCFLVAIAGPWMCVLGAVFGQRPIVQPLTDYLWTGPGAAGDLANQMRLERVFYSLRSCLDTLRGYYRKLEDISSFESRFHFFPYIRKYDSNTFTYTFTYIEKLSGEDLRKQVYKVKEGGSIRVVKFTETYNEEAHKSLAQVVDGECFAPSLFHVSERTYGGRKMIVMDYVDGKTVFEGGTLTTKHLDKLKAALSRLHRRDLVFGDLRDPNIIVKDDNVWLVDFDWCGEEDKAEYPIDLNMHGIDWANGAGPGKPMKRQHDIDMLEKMYVRVLDCS